MNQRELTKTHLSSDHVYDDFKLKKNQSPRCKG